MAILLLQGPRDKAYSTDWFHKICSSSTFWSSEQCNNIQTTNNGILICLLQLYPEMEEIAVANLRSALAYYEKKKDMDERKKKILTEPAPEVEDDGMEAA